MVISTKLPIVKDLIEIVHYAHTDVPERYEDGSNRYTVLQEGFGVKPRHM